MEIARIEKSFELCSEAGWYGYEIHFEQPTEEAFIEALSELGHLLYMKDLKQPFFRVQGEGFLLKGLAGETHFRIGIAGNDKQVLNDVIKRIRKL